MMITRTDAIRIVSVNIPERCTIRREKTIERRWGWLFFWARSPVEQDAGPVEGMYLVQRDGTGYAPETADAAQVIARHERRLLGGEVVGRMRLLLGNPFDPDPAPFQGLRFPVSAREAARAHRAWCNTEPRNYRMADVEVNGDRIIRDVTFDRDSGIAVLVGGEAFPERLELFGCAITRMLELDSDMKRRKVSEAQRNAFASPGV